MIWSLKDLKVNIVESATWLQNEWNLVWIFDSSQQDLILKIQMEIFSPNFHDENEKLNRSPVTA